MHAEFGSTDSLAGTLLAASPKLLDPNFRESLVFIAEHDTTGAFGLILNRPMGKCLGEVISQPGLPPAFQDTPLYFGGPVHPEQMIMALFSPGARDDLIDCRVENNFEQAEAFLNKYPGWLRAFTGYAGWGEGQLEGELSQEAWQVCQPSRVLFKEKALAGMWPVFASGDNRWRRLIDYLPDNPQQN